MMQYSGVCSESQLCALARRCAENLSNNTVLYVQGSVGAGKTTFCRALLHALGVTDNVQSPTYMWMQVYELTGKTIIHMDMYLSQQKACDPHALLADYLDSDPIILIEWPELVQGLPPADLLLQLQGNGSQRDFTLIANTTTSAETILDLQANKE